MSKLNTAGKIAKTLMYLVLGLVALAAAYFGFIEVTTRLKYNDICGSRITQFNANWRVSEIKTNPIFGLSLATVYLTNGQALSFSATEYSERYWNLVDNVENSLLTSLGNPTLIRTYDLANHGVYRLKNGDIFFVGYGESIRCSYTVTAGENADQLIGEIVN